MNNEKNDSRIVIRTDSTAANEEKQALRKIALCDFALANLKRFPTLEKFVNNATVDYQEITDLNVLDHRCDDDDSEYGRWLQASKFAGRLHLRSKNAFHITIFFLRDARPGIFSWLVDADIGFLRSARTLLPLGKDK